MTLYENMAAFFAELAGNGVGDVVVSPGSRSTPLAIAAHRESALRVHVLVDERAAGFFALGCARASRRPVVLVCTSGSAAANYLPAVVEAHYAAVPLIVLTADRPPELRDWGAGQTIDQVGLYAGHVRSFAELPCGRDADAAFFARAGARCVLDALRGRPGPVHRNMPFREPLEPTTDLPAPVESRISVRPGVSHPEPGAVEALAAMLRSIPEGAVIAGPADLDEPSRVAVAEIATSLGWPVLADPASQLRNAGCAPAIAHADLLLRSEDFGDRHAPRAVLRVGASPTSKAIRLWLQRHRPDVALLAEPGAWDDASFTATTILEASTRGSLQALAGALRSEEADSEWLSRWHEADARAAAAVDALDDGALTELTVARAFCRSAGTTMHLASSMPIRDVDTVLSADGVSRRIFANRGANGIDGLVASASGASVVVGRVHLLIGDVALLHDIGSVLEAGRMGRPLTIVLVDNDGGGIFSMLPIAEQGDEVGFRELFTTPHDGHLEAVGAFPGITVTGVADAAALRRALAEEVEGVHVVHARVDRDESLQQRRELARVVASR